MKSIKITLALIFLMVLTLTKINAQAPDSIKTRSFILRSNKVIEASLNALKAQKVLTGNLSEAVRHENYAIKMFIQRNYQASINHSFVARNFALKVIHANRGESPEEGQLTSQEKTLFSSLPSEEILNKELKIIDQTNIPEEGLLKFKNSLDLSLGN